jgi:hypothetical protein
VAISRCYNVLLHATLGAGFRRPVRVQGDPRRHVHFTAETGGGVTVYDLTSAR